MIFWDSFIVSSSGLELKGTPRINLVAMALKMLGLGLKP